jgi:bacteriocin-type transport-associated protein
MREVLLKELNNSDIDWMLATGRRREIAAGTVLVQEGKAVDTLHILIDGTLVTTISQTDKNPLARAFAAIEDNQISGVEIAKLSSGEVVGEIPLIGRHPTATTVKALEKSLVMSIPLLQLETKLEQDAGFASRFYRAIAILLSDRLQNIINRLDRSKLAPDQPIKDVLFIFGDLNDSDIDWIVANGNRQKIAANTVLIREGAPVDALYILLNGAMSLSVSEDRRNPLTRAFAAIEGGKIPSREIARLSKGEIVGESPFIEGRLPSTTVKVLENSLFLSIPRQQLAAKLQQDVGFAARFYRVLATLLSDRLQGMLGRLGYGRRVYRQGQPLNENIEYEDELENSVLDRMALAGKRFDWMQRQLSNISA